MRIFLFCEIPYKLYTLYRNANVYSLWRFGAFNFIPYMAGPYGNEA